jgi:hypothetical protein
MLLPGMGKTTVRRNQKGLSKLNASEVTLLLEAALAGSLIWRMLYVRQAVCFSWKFVPRSVGAVSDVIVSGVLALIVSMSVSAVRPPVPQVHDEFSYLLAADTFAAGRLANDPLPCRSHFETMHVLQQPRYASKYPPLQGLFLAAGQRYLGMPAAGVWLSTAVAAAAACWMLQGWTRRRWAFSGGIMMALHSGLQLDWGQSFMGGAPAVIGGSLVFGALPRWMNRPSAGTGIIGAAGLAVLANSRPFEGLLVCIPVLSVLCRIALQCGRNGTLRTFLIHLLPGLVLLGITAAGMLRYNQELTGDKLTLPYSLHSRQYMCGPLFLWQAPPAARPKYTSETMRQFHEEWETDAYTAQLSATGFLRVKAHYLAKAVFVLLTPLTLAAAAAGLLSSAKQLTSPGGLPVISLLTLLGGASTAVWLFPHYLAPGLPVLMLLIIRGIRQLYVFQIPQQLCGRRLLAGFCSIYIVCFALHAGLHVIEEPAAWAADRRRIEKLLEQTSGDDLVIVKYTADHSPHDEWVYNRAEPDTAPVVWARDLGAAQNSQLCRCFQRRKVWILQADTVPRVLEPQSEEADR